MKEYSDTNIVCKSFGFSLSSTFSTTFLHKESKSLLFFMVGEERSFLNELE